MHWLLCGALLGEWRHELHAVRRRYVRGCGQRAELPPVRSGDIRERLRQRGMHGVRRGTLCERERGHRLRRLHSGKVRGDERRCGLHELRYGPLLPCVGCDHCSDMRSVCGRALLGRHRRDGVVGVHGMRSRHLRYDHGGAELRELQRGLLRRSRGDLAVHRVRGRAVRVSVGRGGVVGVLSLQRGPRLDCRLGRLHELFRGILRHKQRGLDLQPVRRRPLLGSHRADLVSHVRELRGGHLLQRWRFDMFELPSWHLCCEYRYRNVHELHRRHIQRRRQRDSLDILRQLRRGACFCCWGLGMHELPEWSVCRRSRHGHPMHGLPGGDHGGCGRFNDVTGVHQLRCRRIFRGGCEQLLELRRWRLRQHRQSRTMHGVCGRAVPGGDRRVGVDELPRLRCGLVVGRRGGSVRDVCVWIVLDAVRRVELHCLPLWHVRSGDGGDAVGGVRELRGWPVCGSWHVVVHKLPQWHVRRRGCGPVHKLRGGPVCRKLGRYKLRRLRSRRLRGVIGYAELRELWRRHLRRYCGCSRVHRVRSGTVRVGVRRRIVCRVHCLRRR